MFLHMFDANKSLLLEGVSLADLQAGNFAPIADAHLQQDLSAALAWKTALVWLETIRCIFGPTNRGWKRFVDFKPGDG